MGLSMIPYFPRDEISYLNLSRWGEGRSKLGQCSSPWSYFTDQIFTVELFGVDSARVLWQGVKMINLFPTFFFMKTWFLRRFLTTPFIKKQVFRKPLCLEVNTACVKSEKESASKEPFIVLKSLPNHLT